MRVAWLLTCTLISFAASERARASVLEPSSSSATVEPAEEVEPTEPAPEDEPAADEAPAVEDEPTATGLEAEPAVLRAGDDPLAQDPGAELDDGAASSDDGDATPIVLDVFNFSGDAGADVEPSLRAAVQRALEREGARVITPAPGRQACADASCHAALAQERGAQRVVSAQVLVAQRDYEISLRLHEGVDGRVLATSTQVCTICSVPDAEATAEAAVRELMANAPELRAGPASPAPLVVRSEPSGARVFVDGVAAGTTPFERVLEPGDHLIEVEQEGYTTYSQFVTIDPERAHEPLTIAFARAPASFPYTPLGWAGVSVGIASLVAGAVLIGLDEQPYKAQCDGADVDPLGRCRFQYNTLAGGVTGVVVGAALIGGGAALLVLGRRQQRDRDRDRTKRARAQLSLGLRMNGVTLHGRF